MTIDECAKQGIDKVRKSQWSNPDAYLQLHISSEGFHGPWGYLYDEISQRVIGEPTPQTILLIGDTQDDWVPFTKEGK